MSLERIAACVELRLYMSKGWPQSSTDRAESVKVAQQKNADTSRSRVVKRLFDNDVTREISKLFHRASVLVGSYAVPTPSRGTYLVPVGQLESLYTKLVEIGQEVDRLKKRLVAEYETWLEHERTDLNNWFSLSDYPTAEQVEAGTSISFVVVPTPDMSKLRGVVSDEKLAWELESKYREELVRQNKECERRLLEKARDVCQDVIRRGDKYHFGGGKRFRAKSVIASVTECAEVINRLNIIDSQCVRSVAEHMVSKVPSEESVRDETGWTEWREHLRAAVAMTESMLGLSESSQESEEPAEEVPQDAGSSSDTGVEVAEVDTIDEYIEDDQSEADISKDASGQMLIDWGEPLDDGSSVDSIELNDDDIDKLFE
ncbi:MAG: hypothetical protein KatS3mg109_0087 [Pirellulaceae bacterium]|nr:MAG: hypothetical protein KatS3mg109_0087 [Pirellulaceae bacterium]